MNAAQWREIQAKAKAAERANASGAPVVTAAGVKVEPLKLCVNCAWHSCEYDMTWAKTRHACRHPLLLNLVTGERADPATNRNTATLCSREARYFTPRPKVEKVTPAVVDKSEPMEYVAPIEAMPACIRRRRLALASPQGILEDSFVIGGASMACATETALAADAP